MGLLECETGSGFCIPGFSVGAFQKSFFSLGGGAQGHVRAILGLPFLGARPEENDPWSPEIMPGSAIDVS